MQIMYIKVLKVPILTRAKSLPLLKILTLWMIHSLSYPTPPFQPSFSSFPTLYLQIFTSYLLLNPFKSAPHYFTWALIKISDPENVAKSKGHLLVFILLDLSPHTQHICPFSWITFFPVLTCKLMTQKQWWIKVLVL